MPSFIIDRPTSRILTSHFQEYLLQIYSNQAGQTAGEIEIDARRDEDTGQAASESQGNENGARTLEGRLKIVIDWGALDVERETQTISEDQASDSIVKLLVELLGTFGKPMEQQLTELPVIRYPLSRSPATAFVDRATERPFGSLLVPGTDLNFCPHSGTPRKSNGSENCSPG